MAPRSSMAGDTLAELPTNPILDEFSAPLRFERKLLRRVSARGGPRGMSFVHDEGKLRFAFDSDWKILKWDDHGAYVGGLQRFQETKAVDFRSVSRRSLLHRGRDLRGTGSRTRSASGAESLPERSRTRCGIPWRAWYGPAIACRLIAVSYAASCDGSSPVPRRFPSCSGWREDRPPEPALASALGDIKRELAWLNPRVLVTCRSLVQSDPVHGLVGHEPVVTALPESPAPHLSPPLPLRSTQAAPAVLAPTSPQLIQRRASSPSCRAAPPPR